MEDLHGNRHVEIFRHNFHRNDQELTTQTTPGYNLSNGYKLKRQRWLFYIWKFAVMCMYFQCNSGGLRWT